MSRFFIFVLLLGHVLPFANPEPVGNEPGSNATGPSTGLNASLDNTTTVKAKTSAKYVRASLDYCFETKEINCFVGNGCVEENVRRHSKIVSLSVQQRIRLKSVAEWRREVANCDVGATIQLPPDNKGMKGVYNIEFHWTPEYRHLRINFGKRQIWIEDGNVRCEPRCDFHEESLKLLVLTEEERAIARGRFVDGLIFFIESTEGSTPHPLAQEAEVVVKTAKASKLSTYLIIGGCLLLLAIVVAVGAGTIIQRRQSAKNKRRREAIEHKVSARAAEMSTCSSGEQRTTSRASKKETEKAALIEKTAVEKTAPSESLSGDSTPAQFSIKDMSKHPINNRKIISAKGAKKGK